MAARPDLQSASILGRNTATLSVGRLASKLLAFLMIRFYTAMLTKEQFGSADLIVNVANLLIPLACAGLSSGFFRFAAEASSPRELSDNFSTGVCILSAASVLFALFSPLLMLIPHVGEYTLLILLYVLCANVHYLVSEFVRAQGNFTLFAVQGLINTALNLGFGLLFLLPLDMGLQGYVLSIVAADLCTSVFLILRCRLWRYLRAGSVASERLGRMLRYCIPLIPASLCWWITNASDRYMVTYFCGEAANGLYAAAYRIPNLLTIACGVFLEAWHFSAVTENSKIQNAADAHEQARERRSLSAFFSRVLRGYSALLFLAAAALAVCARPICRILLDPSFEGAASLVPILLLAAVLSALSNFVQSVYVVELRSVASLLTALLGAVLNVILNLILIPRFGAMGAAVATVLAYLAVLIARIATSRGTIAYRYSPVRLWVSIGTLTIAAIVLPSRMPGRILLILLSLSLLLLFNFPPLWHSLRRLIQSKRSDGKSQESSAS